jgi:hypothetical protein
MFSKTMPAGAVALLAAPMVVIAGTLAQPTLSGDAATQVAALTGHRAAMITGVALGVSGLLVVLFENSVAAGPAIAGDVKRAPGER